MRLVHAIAGAVQECRLGTYDCCIAMVVILLVGDEIDLAQELLLVMLEFAHHDCGVGLLLLFSRTVYSTAGNEAPGDARGNLSQLFSYR